MSYCFANSIVTMVSPMTEESINSAVNHLASQFLTPGLITEDTEDGLMDFVECYAEGKDVTEVAQLFLDRATTTEAPNGRLVTLRYSECMFGDSVLSYLGAALNVDSIKVITTVEDSSVGIDVDDYTLSPALVPVA